MATTTISITLDAYKRLAALKKARESFSDVINRVTRRGDIMKCVGILSERQADKLERNIKLTRKKHAEADHNRIARLRRMFK